MGPLGMIEVGETIMRNSAYAAKKIGGIEGIQIHGFQSHFFKEFAVNFDKTGLTVEKVNRELLSRGIFGGKDISQEFPELGQTAIYCVTEVHRRNDVLLLCDALEEIVHGAEGGRSR
jgi:glycine dehydrogenase subunit 1